MFAAAGVPWRFDRFDTPNGRYPESFDDYDVVLLTGSKADSFSDEPWVQELRRRVTGLLQQRKKLLGICFGHQLIAHCLGAEVGRAPKGWGMPCRIYYKPRDLWTLVDQSDSLQRPVLLRHRVQITATPYVAP